MSEKLLIFPTVQPSAVSAELRIAALRLQMRNAPRAPLSLLPCAVLLPSQLGKAQLYSQLKLSSLAVQKREVAD